jgi:glutamine synthetase
MNAKEVIEEVKKSKTKKVKIAVTDMDGVLRGKIIHIDKFISAIEGGFGFCEVVFGWDMNDACYENTGVEFTGWHNGYPDAAAKIDLATFRKVPWDEDIPFFLADFDVDGGSAREICPRTLLKNVKKELEQNGYSASFAQEYEWFNFKETSEDLHQSGFQKPNPMTKGMFGYSVVRASQEGDFFNDLFDLMDKFDVTIEGLHTETGPGVYEAAILYKDVLEAADRSVLFKTAAKEIGHFHGVIPTFMAKWSSELPGCSGHLHQSLWKDGKNIFFDGSSKNKMSQEMESYIAGQLLCLPEILPMYAPTINSYKRLVEGMWAPTTLTWAIDNRTTAIRALPGSEKSTRIELRVVGSDMNPYLAMAAALASGYYGIKNNLKLDSPMTIGNGYEDLQNGSLPRDLFESTEKMANSKLANDLFGEVFVKHFCATRKWECKQYAKSVTDWELKRYFEVI